MSYLTLDQAFEELSHEEQVSFTLLESILKKTGLEFTSEDLETVSESLADTELDQNSFYDLFHQLKALSDSRNPSTTEEPEHTVCEPPTECEAKDEPVCEAKDEPVCEAKDKPVCEAKDKPVCEAKDEPVCETKDEPVYEAPKPAVQEQHTPQASVSSTTPQRSNASVSAESNTRPNATPARFTAMTRSTKIGPGNVSTTEDSAFDKESKTRYGGSHKYNQRELRAFTSHINQTLGSDSYLESLLPIDPESEDLFSALSDGIILCKLINAAQDQTIDERVINFPKQKPLNRFEKIENLVLAINAARVIGCIVISMGPNELMSGVPHLTLGILWQIIRIQLLSSISLQAHPELAEMYSFDIEDGDLMNDDPQDVLLKWINYHLKKNMFGDTIDNFGTDLKDCTTLVKLMSCLFPHSVTLEPLNYETNLDRASYVVQKAKENDVYTFVTPEDLISGNSKFGLSFIASLFNTTTGMNLDADALKFITPELEDTELSREEENFKVWVNSLALPDVRVRKLVNECFDGLIILRIFDRIEPGSVEWKKVNMDPKNKFKRLENCNYAITVAKQFNFSVVNNSGLNILDRDRKMILAIIWQQVRYFLLKMLKTVGVSSKMDENKVLDWANSKVNDPSLVVRGFGDKMFSDSFYLITLLSRISTRVDTGAVVRDATDEETLKSNARYTLGVAMKLGVIVFLTWQDVVEVKSRMIMAFVASIMYRSELNGKH